MVRIPEELIHLLTIELAVIFLIFALIFYHVDVGASRFHGKTAKRLVIIFAIVAIVTFMLLRNR